MELYINNTWTRGYGHSYTAEAIVWSENGNHASIYTTGNTAGEADAKLMGALCELKLIPGASAETNSSKKEGQRDGLEALPDE